jgi:large subunit ribosomal protein L6
MSRLAGKPITFDKGITVTLKDDAVMVKGSKGELKINMQPDIVVKLEENKIVVERTAEAAKAFQGLIWSQLRNAVVGLTTGFSKKLEVVGKGWRSTVKGDVINLQVGHSHPVDFKLPKGITATQDNPGSFTLHSFDKHLLGQTAANIKALRPVEPYKLKGIRITGQHLRQKVRKAAGV